MVEDKCWRRLLAHVIILALEDLQRPKHRQDALDFFASERLDRVADALSLHPERVRQKVAEGVDVQPLRYMRRAHKGRRVC
jgi:hypothetical protein